MPTAKSANYRLFAAKATITQKSHKMKREQYEIRSKDNSTLFCEEVQGENVAKEMEKLSSKGDDDEDVGENNEVSEG